MVDDEIKPVVNALKYPFANWQRLFYILWNLIPILGSLAYYGYVIKILANVIEGKDIKQPPKFGKFFENLGVGFAASIVSLAYIIPIYILWFPYLLLVGENVPLILLGYLIFFPAFLVVGALLVMAICRFAKTHSFSAAFDVSGNWWLVRKNIMDLIVLFLIYIILGMMYLIPFYFLLFIGIMSIVASMLNPIMLAITVPFAIVIGVLAMLLTSAYSYTRTYILGAYYSTFKKPRGKK